jgi:hypothetical protein
MAHVNGVLGKIFEYEREREGEMKLQERSENSVLLTKNSVTFKSSLIGFL